VLTGKIVGFYEFLMTSRLTRMPTRVRIWLRVFTELGRYPICLAGGAA